MVPIWMMSVPIALTDVSSAVTPEQANESSPAALGDRLLPKPHRIIVQKVIGPEGLDPPPPPGGPETTEIRLWDVGHDSHVSGFCEKTRYTIFLAPTLRNANGNLPPARPAKIITTRTYRLKPHIGDAIRCEADAFNFFPLARESDGQLIFSTIRLLAEAQQTARPGQKLGFAGSIDDALGREIGSLSSKDPAFNASIKQANPEALNRFDDWRAELVRYPLDKIARYCISKPGEVPDSDQARSITLDAGGMGGWLEAAVTIDRGRIRNVDLKRFIPPSF